MDPVILAKTDEERASRSVELAALLERLEVANPEACLLEPRDLYDLALTDITDAAKDHWGRKEKVFVAVYSTQACIKAIMQHLDCDDAEAWEWFGFNTSGGWYGEGTPTFTCHGCDVGDCDGGRAPCPDHADA